MPRLSPTHFKTKLEYSTKRRLQPCLNKYYNSKKSKIKDKEVNLVCKIKQNVKLKYCNNHIPSENTVKKHKKIIKKKKEKKKSIKYTRISM